MRQIGIAAFRIFTYKFAHCVETVVSLIDDERDSIYYTIVKMVASHIWQVSRIHGGGGGGGEEFKKKKK